MENKPIRIIIVDDHALARESWKMVLERNPRLQVIALCDNGATAIEMAQQLMPDIMMVDVNMSPLNGFAVTEKMSANNPKVKIIGLSVNNQIYYVKRMFELGAKGYLTKTSPLEEVEQGILKVYEGEQYVCNEIKRNMPVSEDEAGK